jgi:hypothetical protein
VRGDKGAIVEANELEAYGEHQVNKANTRLPYHSTLLQTQSFQPAELTIDQKYWARPVTSPESYHSLPHTPPVASYDVSSSGYVTGTSHATPDAVTGGFKNLIVPSPDPKQGPTLVDGLTTSPPETALASSYPKGTDGKASDDLAEELDGWLDQRTDKANTRLPYHSTLQLEDSVQSPDDLQLINLRDDDPSKMETLEESASVPLNFHFVEMKDDDPSKIETLEDTSAVPINFRLLHVSTEEGDLYRTEQQ